MTYENERYNPAVIEPKWQNHWAEHRTFEAKRRPGKPKYYILDMFPYPSGAGLHVGHPEGYTATDILARYKRMNDVDVLHPMGWDAFGLPAEQFAIKTGTHPAITTKKNIQTFRRQLKSLGFSYDWTREVATTDESYVRWTQWIFLQIFKRGLAYQSSKPVNWCPALGTVLANEEVIDGKSERGGHPVERLPIRQWMLQITAYADKLESELEGLDWPDTKIKQRNWIGRSVGAQVRFAVQGQDAEIEVFTTRPDTLFGCTYMVLAPEHELVSKLVSDEQRQAAEAYQQSVGSKSDRDRTANVKEKTGVFTGAYAVHPLTKEPLPIWIADFVLASYGTGAIMSVPAHDQRDFEFAKTFDLPIVEVVSNNGKLHDAQSWPEAKPADGINVRSDFLDGLKTDAAKQKMIDRLGELSIGEAKINYKLRDWIFSRQRYWGEPIPIYFPVTLAEGSKDPRTDDHEIDYASPIAVDEAELPLRLPDLEDFSPSDDPAGALGRALDWRYFEKDGKWFARETNTMPQWAGSCWYYLRFIDPENESAPFSEEAYNQWMPVDLYVGGAEHAVLHLLYARFWHKVLYDAGVVKDPEPFKKLVHQGIILGEDARKMSKSLGNVVNPDTVVKEFGADSLRVYEMFMGPLEQVKPWQTKGVVGVRRFLDKVWKVCSKASAGGSLTSENEKLLHKQIKKVGEDIEKLRFNTAVSALMILTNALEKERSIPLEAAQTLALLISPFAPHLAEELWQRAGSEGSLAYHAWPSYDPALLVEDVLELPVQINKKVRGKIKVAKGAGEPEIREAISADAGLTGMLAGKTEKMFRYVPERIVTIVVVLAVLARRRLLAGFGALSVGAAGCGYRSTRSGALPGGKLGLAVRAVQISDGELLTELRAGALARMQQQGIYARQAYPRLLVELVGYNVESSGLFAQEGQLGSQGELMRLTGRGWIEKSKGRHFGYDTGDVNVSVSLAVREDSRAQIVQRQTLLRSLCQRLGSSVVATIVGLPAPRGRGL